MELKEIIGPYHIALLIYFHSNFCCFYFIELNTSLFMCLHIISTALYISIVLVLTSKVTQTLDLVEINHYTLTYPVVSQRLLQVIVLVLLNHLSRQPSYWSEKETPVNHCYSKVNIILIIFYQQDIIIVVLSKKISIFESKE